MVRAAGIHIDQNSFRLIALDGSPKKHRVVATIQGEVLPGEDPVAVVSSALKKGVKEHKLDLETVGLVVDSGLAAFRELSLPFDDDDKIEEVLKFEIESELPQWNIDDVIVDYVTVATKPGVQSDLLVTAMPKDRLQLQIEACEAAGLEPNEAELDGTALFNAAKGAGLLHEEEAQILVHVGDASTALVLVDGGRLIGMRTIRVGVGQGTAPPAPQAGGDELAEAAEPDPIAAATRLDKSVQRVRREILRSLSGARFQNPVSQVLLSGHELPGLADEDFEGAQSIPLAIVTHGSEEPLAPMFAVAYGSALRELGSDALKPHLRREELRYSGKFERLELPLAVLSLLLVTFLAVKFITIQKQIDWHEANMTTWMQASNNFLFPDPTAETPYPGRLKNPSEDVLAFATRAANGEIDTMTGFEQLRRVRELLQREKAELEIEVGTRSEYEQPLSSLSALMLVMGTIDELGDRVGRFAFRRVAAQYQQGSSGSGDVVQITLDIDFHAEDSTQATANFGALREALDTKRPVWALDFDYSSTDPLENGKGISIDGLKIEVNPMLALDEAS